MDNLHNAAGLRVASRIPMVLTIELDRPERSNALDLATVQALRAQITRTDARAIVLASTSARVFCAGADLSIDEDERAQVSRELYDLYGEMIASPLPILAALTGAAVGGGAQLAIASDLRVAAPDAWMRFVGPGHGLAVGAWGLPSLVGRGHAIDLCLSGRRVAAEEGRAMGLVQRIAEDPVATAEALAEEWAALDHDAVARVKAIAGSGASPTQALGDEARGNAHWKGETR